MSDLLLFLFGLVLVSSAIWARTQFGSFMAQTPDDYSGTGPDFLLREQLNGALACEGVIFGPTGRVSSRFTADMDIAWDGDCGVMRERFYYDTGETQDREWRLIVSPDGTIKAEADDVAGTGTGRQRGASVFLKYRIKLPEASGGHILDARDWMYLVEDGKIINRSQFRKFGIKVAELVATMRKVDAS